ncbi:phytosulfokines 5-like [Bidens hawaiensis]|uniref:phytosulfokines 5-like n=1 Tax=Bidens hawaiensis TaxID=980011 RepID=UPI0040491DC2
MSKATTLCTLALLLRSTLSYAVARSPPAFSNITPDEEIAKRGYGELKCEGDGEEECLMRRTLASHLDYIYTQNKQP